MKWNGKLKSIDQLQSSRTKCDSVCMEQWQLYEQEGKEVNEMMISSHRGRNKTDMTINTREA